MEIITEPKLKKREKDTHKGNYGTALSFSGSFTMPGAAILSSRAVLRSGVGILKAAVDKRQIKTLISAVPEAVTVPYNNGFFGIGKRDIAKIKEEVKKADAVLVGPGLSTDKTANIILKTVLENAKNKVIIDADGINMLSKYIDLVRRSSAQIVITPHPKELSRLISVPVNEITENREHYAKSTAKNLKCTVLLKGNNTVISDCEGNTFENPTGNPGMATGGSGDVLSGIILALLANGYDGLTSAKYGAYIHGAAGDMAAKTKSETSLLPSDIIDELPEFFLSLGR